MLHLRGYFKVVKEITRHVLRRPVVGIVTAATTADGRWLLIRRGDTGQWAMPGGTLEWGETLQEAATRELAEEAGVEHVKLGSLLGVYSAPHRDERFHAVTIVVRAEVEAPVRPPMNPVEIREVGLFAESDLPSCLAHNMGPMLENARKGRLIWE